jgi:hypothetical protein
MLIIQGVSVKTFAEIEEERESRRSRHRFRFSAKSGILIITIPTVVHESLHVGLWDKVNDEIYQMGLRPNWRTFGAPTLRALGCPGGDGGEPDSSGGPKPEREAANAWPSLVIEAGYSQTMGGLRQVMRWWFETSDHHVKIVLLAKLNYRAREIIIEKWTENQANPRVGAMTTRAGGAYVQNCRQTIAIAQIPGIRDGQVDRIRDPASYVVTSGALRLEFELLFLRQPRPGEGDIVLSIQQLQGFAAQV